MSFIGSPLYYFLCVAALAILVLLLIGCQIKTRRSPGKTPPPSPRPEPTARKPRYAAGDNMDRINRNAHVVNFEKRRSDAPAIIGSTIIGLLIFLAIPQIINTVNQEKNSTSNTVIAAAPAPTQPVSTGTVELHIISAEFSSDLTKLFVTYEYINNSSLDIHSITPTVNILNAEGEVIQSKEAEIIENILQGESREVITSMELDTTTIKNASKVTVTSSYEK